MPASGVPAAATLSGDTASVCPATSVRLTAVADKATSYKWYKGDAVIAGATDSTYTASESGTYYAVGVNAKGEGTQSAGKAVRISPCVPLQATIAGDTANACPDTSVTLTASAADAISYVWYNGDIPLADTEGSDTYTVTESGTYYVEGINNGSTGTRSVGKRVVINKSKCILQQGFTIDAAAIGNYTPAADSISGTITHTGGSDYAVRRTGNVWWMIQNANKALNTGCTSIDRDTFGHLYSWDCAQNACPPGWSLPTDADFAALSDWLTDHDKWSEWNSGLALAGNARDTCSAGCILFDGKGSFGYWWSKSSNNKYWRVWKDATGGGSFVYDSRYSVSVRCRK
ncbi:hypothetical protein FACS189456_0430 [Bacteroidia bacterium]|nr:hypothetical protein FACS189456_0430 [Bacteroidia bacterium]